MGCLVLSATLILTPAGAGDLRFDRISLEQGLSQSTVNSIVQDRAGFLWLGTQDGLNRYDGYDFLVFRNDPADPSSLSNNAVRALYLDRAGMLWACTSGGLNRLDPAGSVFERYLHDPADEHSLSHNSVWMVLEDGSGSLWVATDGGGLDRLGPGRGMFEHLRHDPENPESLGHDEVRAIYRDRAGGLWIGTTGGLDRLDDVSDPGHAAFSHFRHDPGDPSSLSHDVVTALHQDRLGNLWIGTDGGGLDRFEPESGTFRHYRHDPGDSASLGHDEVRTIFEDLAGTLWVGTDGGGLSALEPQTGALAFRSYRSRSGDPFSLSNDFVRSIYQDRSEVLWVGTDGGGLNKLDLQRNAFAHYRHDPFDAGSLSHDMVFSIRQDRSGDLWIGTWGGLNRLDSETGGITHYRHDPADPGSLASDEIWPVYEDRQGDLWIGTFGGLDRLGPRRRTFTHYRHDPEIPGSLSHDYVRVIQEDRAGNLWIGTDGGLNRFDRRRETFIAYRHDSRHPDSLSHDDVRAIREDRAGVLWLGTAGGGLNRFERTSPNRASPNRASSERALPERAATDSGRAIFRHYRHAPGDPESLSNDFVRSIHEDRDGRLWIGTDDGLNLFDPSSGRFVRYRTTDGLPNNVVYGILEDDAGRLWISTNGGLARFDPRTGAFRNYDVSDGLQSNEFNTGAYYRSPDGEMFFGGIQGLNAFFPDAIRDNPYRPPVVLTAFKRFNQAVELDRPISEIEEIALSYRDDFIGFGFAALDFRSPEKNRYAYQLEGFDDRWVEAGRRREATYTNLDPGRYVFRVKASNNDGVWNPRGASVRIVIRPPFWATWWFRALVAATVAATLLALHRHLMARGQRLQQELAERARAAEREGLIRELEAKNTELERFTYSVSHDLKSPLVTVLGFLGFLERDVATAATGPGAAERVAGDIRRIRGAATQMQRLIDDLLELSQVGRKAKPPEAVAMTELAEDVRELLAGEIDERSAEVVIAPDLPVVHGDRVRLQQLLQNLIQNALRYMGDQPAPRIELAARPGDIGRSAVIYVRDNGAGVAPEHREKIFELFQRLDAETSGTGVGLALARRIVETHGGRIWVESEGAGRGSTFCFTLPG